MCTHYLDLVLQPDPEFGAPMLMAALYAKLHRALVAAEQQAASPEVGAGVGVSFPQHDEGVPTLGGCMRLHGGEAALAALMGTAWLRGVRDHLADAAPAIAPVPEGVKGHRAVCRVQVQSSAERLRRRLMRRHPEVDDSQARRRIPDTVAQTLSLPFVPFTSSSTGQPFKLFIRHGALQEQAVVGRFNAYGLSQQGTTVPWF